MDKKKSGERLFESCTPATQKLRKLAKEAKRRDDRKAFKKQIENRGDFK